MLSNFATRFLGFVFGLIVINAGFASSAMAQADFYKGKTMTVHGSTGSLRTDGDTSKFKDLAVRPETLEGRTANCATLSMNSSGGSSKL